MAERPHSIRIRLRGVANFANSAQVTMNRWLTRKNKDGGDDAASVKKKKGKKAQEEVKPAFDLNEALPKVDDFRTSLIMPGLSTRFSMLREQDDPSSKLGKASDDSVLQPRRQSRLHDFGFVPTGLTDIAEVSSLNGSIRPPFANERTNSFDSSRDSEAGGSVMSRARPGEGNILFGGRQKIYMISNNSTTGVGRTLYEDDVNLSAYQKMKRDEKERLRLQLEEHDGRVSDPESPTAMSRKRETTSSADSGTLDARSSTAATSITSQGGASIGLASPSFPPVGAPLPSPDLNRSTTKARRLYDQGLDNHIQEQQSSAMNRLNSIARARAPTGRSTPPIAQARSATNLNDRFNRGAAFRSDSPTGFLYGRSRGNSSAGSSPVLPRPQSPPLVSPVISEGDEAQTLNAALQPHDRGKATALGAFNKPKEAFSEEQYAERLRQLQQDRTGRESPAFKERELPKPREMTPPREIAQEETRAASPPKGSRSPPRKPTLRERAELEKKRRAESEAAEKSKVEEAPMPNPAAAAISRFQAAASQMKVNGPATPQVFPPAEEAPARTTTFFSSADSSDEEEEPSQARPPMTTSKSSESARKFELPVATGPAPPIFDHPALRSRSASRSREATPIALNTQDASPPPTRAAKPEAAADPSNADVDSPTLGDDNGGLSVLIRQHLRNVSNVSSNYDAESTLGSPPPTGLALQTQNIGFQRRQPGSENETPAASSYSHSNPWDLDDIDNPYRDERDSQSSVSPIDQKAAPLIMSATEPSAPWTTTDLTPKRNHERVASNETEAEHEAFQRDLAQRQQLIQQNLRARAEGRSTSPAPTPSGGLKTALNMLRAKSSRESFATVDRQPEIPNRAVRKLTLGSNSNNNSSTSLVGSYGGDMHSSKMKPTRVLQQSEQDAQREMENRQRSGTDASRTGRPTGRPAPISTRSSTRERSVSNASSGGGRSRSRPAQFRDEVEDPIYEDTRAGYSPNPASGYNGHATPLHSERPSLENQARMRSRSNSRTTAAHHFESKHLQPIQTGPASGNVSPRLPLPANFSPGLPISPRPSPGFSKSPIPSPFHQPTSPMPPFSASHTPPVSNPTTPNAAAFNPSAVPQPMIRQGMLRKKSIAKADISEPIFISTTSNIDLVSLPPGASLKNGAEPAPPPVPPINPMRRRFGLGRSDKEDAALEAPRAPYAEPSRTNSSDALHSQAQQQKNSLRKTTSEGHSLRGQASGYPSTSPAMPQGGFVDRNNSPPRPINNKPMIQQPVEGGMF